MPKGLGPDNASGYLKGSIAGGGLWRALEILDDAVLQSSVNSFDNVTLTCPNIGANEWTDANHTHASAATAGSTLGPGTTLSTPTLQTPAVSGVMTFGGDATLSRTGPGALRADTHLGVGVNPAAWLTGQRALQVGAYGSVVDGTGTVTDDAVSVNHNGVLTASGWQALAAGGGSSLQIGAQGNLRFYVAPPVAAGAALAFVQKMQVAPTGTLTLTPDAGTNALQAGPLFGNQYCFTNPLSNGVLTSTAGPSGSTTGASARTGRRHSRCNSPPPAPSP